MIEKNRPLHPALTEFTWQLLGLLILALLLLLLTSCASQAAPTQVVAKTVVVTQEVVKTVEVPKEVEKTTTSAPAAQATQLPLTARPQATSTPIPQLTQAEATTLPAQPAASPTPVIEARLVELEWPARLRFGESDVVRLSLVPSKEGYKVETDFSEHDVQTRDVQVKRLAGYELSALARLDAVAFDVAPPGEQEQPVPDGERVDWRWTLTPRQEGQQRLTVILRLRWTPLPGTQGTRKETTAYSKAINIQVTSFLGLTRGQAVAGGLLGLVFGGGLSLGVLIPLRRLPWPALRSPAPNPDLVVEPHPGLKLSGQEHTLLRMLFGRYSRLALESEFLSGYSGARTFLALPIRPDGRADAYTIVKMGERSSIQREFENYEAFVKDTLPPVTARIQHAPVALPVRALHKGDGREAVALAALQYTFIAEPGRTPTSLRQALRAEPDPSRLLKLFEVFGPNWWMQRRPYTFHLAQEYDVMLPTHLVVEPCKGRGRTLDGRTPPAELDYQPGQTVTLHHFPQMERRSDGRSLSLRGEPGPGQPVLRVRWQGLSNPNGASGRVVSTRWTVLREWTAGMDLHGLPDPLERLPEVLKETVSGTQSVIHGDLNLENVLVGPGDFVWLIDFAQTREGHTLFDFAHLYAEIVAHILALQISSSQDYVSLLQEPDQSSFKILNALLSSLEEIAYRCLFNPSQAREWRLAQFAACLGALKFANLTPHARHLLYLTAGHIRQRL